MRYKDQMTNLWQTTSATPIIRSFYDVGRDDDIMPRAAVYLFYGTGATPSARPWVSLF